MVPMSRGWSLCSEAIKLKLHKILSPLACGDTVTAQSLGDVRPKRDKVVVRKGSMGRKLDPMDGGGGGGGNCGLKSSPFLGLVDKGAAWCGGLFITLVIIAELLRLKKMKMSKPLSGDCGHVSDISVWDLQSM